MELIIVCKNCGKEFIDNNCPSRRRKCCSFNCSRNVCESKLIHGKREKSPSWHGGTTIDKNGYIYVLDSLHPMANSLGYVPKHRWIMSNFLGRILLSSEIVHHIDRDKTNNSIGNLELMTDKSHKSLHGVGRKMPNRWKR